jgi:Fe-S-cluster containining protein
MKTDSHTDDYLTGSVDLSIGDNVLHLEMSVPKAPVPPARLLPLFRSLAEKIIDLGVKSIEADGETISCKKGCGACCRQLVPISQIEARYLNELVNEMAEPRRTEIKERFAQARERLVSTGLLEKLLHPENFSNEELQALGLDYFHRGIACPFLEEESCSIHLERPIACREYLVTSPAENCANPTAETVRMVKIAGKVSNAVSRINEDPSARFIKWVPLIVALEWAETHKEEEPMRPATEIIQELFSKLSRKNS